MLEDMNGRHKRAVGIDKKSCSMDSHIELARGASVRASYGSYARLDLLDRAYELVGLFSVNW